MTAILGVAMLFGFDPAQMPEPFEHQPPVPVIAGVIAWPEVDVTVAFAAENNRISDERPGPIRGELTIEQRVIIRIPINPKAESRPRADVSKAKQGPKCVPLQTIRGAAEDGEGTIIFMTTRGERYAARLEKGCQSFVFHNGFYIDPARDGLLCAGRDVLHARSGASCVVNGFLRMPGDE